MSAYAPSVHAGERDTEHESVLARANSVLSAFGPRSRTLSLSGIVMRTGLPKSTVHRTAQQMIKLGWLNYREGQYSLGTRMFEFRRPQPGPHRVARIGPAVPRRPVRGHARDRAPGRHGRPRDLVHRQDLRPRPGHRPVPCRRPDATALHVAGQVDPGVLAPGRAARSDQPWPAPVHRLHHHLGGHAGARADRGGRPAGGVDRQESSMDIICAGAPVFGSGQQVVAALSVTSPVGRARLDQIAPVSPLRPGA